MLQDRYQLSSAIWKEIFRAISLVTVISLAGCAQQLWVKPGASQNDFASDRYACLQESQQQGSSARVNAYGGAAESGSYTNQGLFISCMTAKGWAMQDAKAAQEQTAITQSNVNEQMNEFNQKYDEICSNSQYAPLFAKTPCKATDVTFEQLTDSTKITPEQKPLLTKYRTSIDKLTKEKNAYLRTNGESFSRLADYNDEVQPEIDKYNLDLYNGLITWGEYNQRRKDFTAKQKIDVQRILQNKH